MQIRTIKQAEPVEVASSGSASIIAAKASPSWVNMDPNALHLRNVEHRELGSESAIMIQLISEHEATRILKKYEEHIRTVAERYNVPEAVIKAILFQEMTTIDAVDPIADFAVLLAPRFKQDSSTGYAQIFGYVGINAINFAVDRELATYESLGIASNHRLDPSNQDDVRTVWLKLYTDRKANIEIATLNIMAAANQMTGRIDFTSFSDDELKLVFTRYNADVKHVTPYGEQVFELYKAFSEE